MLWIITLLALLALGFPGDWLIPPGARLSSYQGINHAGFEPSCIPRWVSWRGLPELLRAAAGSAALSWALPQIPFGGPQGWIPVLVAVPLVLGGVVLQCVTVRREDTFLAPIAYGLGLLFGLVPWPLALAVAAVAAGGIGAFRGFGPYFFLCPIVLIPVGYALVREQLGWILLTAAAELLPLVLAMAFKCPLRVALPRKAGAHGTATKRTMRSGRLRAM